MQYLTLLGVDDNRVPAPGTPERSARQARYLQFGRSAAGAVIAGDALAPGTAARTVRHGDGGEPLVTEGPYAETTETLGGYYVLEAESLDDAIELARRIPTATEGWVALRPLVMWQATDQAAPTGHRYLALIYGKESDADIPGTPAWDDGAREHGRFVEQAAGHVLAGGALHPIDSTTTVRLRDGELLVTDGPFGEAAEVVGGLYLLAAPTTDRAVEVAARIPVNPGGAVEVRPILELG